MHSVTVSDDGFRLFEGRISSVGIEPTQATVQCEGWYAHGNDVFLDLLYPLATAETAYSIVSDCIDSSTRWDTTKAHLLDTGLPTINVADVDYMDDWHLNDVIDDVCKIGTNSANSLYFAIWEGRVCYLFERPSLTSENIDWHIHPFDFAGGQQGYMSSRDATKFGNKIAVIYSSGQGMRDITTEVTDDDSITRYGTVQRRLSVAGLEQTVAETVRDLTIAERAFPPTSVRALIDGNVWKGGNPYPVNRVRAGDVVALHVNPNTLEGDQNTTLAFVVATSYAAGNNRMKLDLDVSPSSLEVILAWFGLSGGRLI